MDVDVYQVQRAPAPVSGWLSSLLVPVLLTLRAPWLPVEIRPCGAWAGWSPGGRRANPARRISISSKVVFWSPVSVVSVFVHELAHHLLDELEPDSAAGLHGHDACFFALQMAFFLKLDLAEYLKTERVSGWFCQADFYDLQDPPLPLAEQLRGVWLPVALGWAIKTAHELAALDVGAIELARIADDRYWIWMTELEAEPARIEAERLAADKVQAQRRAELDGLTADRHLYLMLAWLFGAGFVASVLLFLKRVVA